MSYSSTSIKKVITDIDANKVYLPALQRKFVWGKRQIQLLFDSLMGVTGLPLGFHAAIGHGICSTTSLCG